MAVRCCPHCYPGQAQCCLSPASSGVCKILQAFSVLCPILQSYWSNRFHGHSSPGAWWIPVYYAVMMFVLNIGGEELWWRGYVLPRQGLAFGKMTWIVHGVFWSAFHLFMQPTLWDTARMAISGVALAYVARRTKSTWPGIVGHTFGNLPLFLSLIRGVTSR